MLRYNAPPNIRTLPNIVTLPLPPLQGGGGWIDGANIIIPFS